MHQQNRKKIHLILARITDHVSVQSGMESRYAELIGEGKTKYEVEHVWSNSPERHEDEFSHQTEFLEYRDRIGVLFHLIKVSKTTSPSLLDPELKKVALLTFLWSICFLIGSNYLL